MATTQVAPKPTLEVQVRDLTAFFAAAAGSTAAQRSVTTTQSTAAAALAYALFLLSKQGFSLKGRMEIPLFTREKQGGSQCSSCGCLGCCSCGMPTGRSPQGSTSYRRGERGKNPHLSL